ncbi:hypothetical protein ABZ468_53425 [Streptomyces sp. NPDC005708]|uniref:hypothetical protein n=1 Tax=Streptomyces sp. NPDC005708 TaxID=3154564 RepID=UPI00340972E5
MIMTDDRPRLTTPTGGAESKPERPLNWHGHPYVWAWNVCLGATNPTFIEGECLAADLAGAPADAVYKDERDEWITVGMIVHVDRQQRVREYAQALIKWEAALKAYRSRPVVRPLREAKQSEGGPERGGEEFEYCIAFTPSTITGVVRARSLREAYAKLTSGEQFSPSGYGVLDLTGPDGVMWHVGFDSTKSRIIGTNDPYITEAPTPGEEEPTGPDTPPAPAVPGTGRGVIRVKRWPQS